MPRDDIGALILVFLERPDDESTIRRILENGEDSFEEVDSYSGPFPAGVDPRDAGDTLDLLLARIGDRYPAKLAHYLRSRAFWAKKWRYLYIAARSPNRSFGPLIVEHLSDRSGYVRDAAVDILSKHQDLWSVDAADRLRKLLKGKAVDQMTTKKHQIEELLRAIEQRI